MGNAKGKALMVVLLLTLIAVMSSPLYSQKPRIRAVPQVAAGNFHTVGLRADGTVVAVGWNDYDQCDVSGWSGIIQVAAVGDHTVGLKADGTVVAVGLNHLGQCDVSGWSGISRSPRILPHCWAESGRHGGGGGVGRLWPVQCGELGRDHPGLGGMLPHGWAESGRHGGGGGT